MEGSGRNRPAAPAARFPARRRPRTCPHPVRERSLCFVPLDDESATQIQAPIQKPLNLETPRPVRFRQGHVVTVAEIASMRILVSGHAFMDAVCMIVVPSRIHSLDSLHVRTQRLLPVDVRKMEASVYVYPKHWLRGQIDDGRDEVDGVIEMKKELRVFEYGHLRKTVPFIEGIERRVPGPQHHRIRFVKKAAANGGGQDGGGQTLLQNDDERVRDDALQYGHGGPVRLRRLVPGPKQNRFDLPGERTPRLRRASRRRHPHPTRQGVGDPSRGERPPRRGAPGHDRRPDPHRRAVSGPLRGQQQVARAEGFGMGATGEQGEARPGGENLLPGETSRMNVDHIIPSRPSTPSKRGTGEPVGTCKRSARRTIRARGISRPWRNGRASASACNSSILNTSKFRYGNWNCGVDILSLPDSRHQLSKCPNQLRNHCCRRWPVRRKRRGTSKFLYSSFHHPDYDIRRQLCS